MKLIANDEKLLEKQDVLTGVTCSTGQTAEREDRNVDKSLKQPNKRYSRWIKRKPDKIDNVDDGK